MYRVCGCWLFLDLWENFADWCWHKKDMDFADTGSHSKQVTDDHPYAGEPTQLKLAGQTQTWKTFTTCLRKLACRDSGLLVLLSWPCLNQDASEKINVSGLQAKMAGRAFANWGCSFASSWNWSLCVCCLCRERPSTWWRASMAPRVLGRHPVEIPNHDQATSQFMGSAHSRSINQAILCVLISVANIRAPNSHLRGWLYKYRIKAYI